MTVRAPHRAPAATTHRRTGDSRPPPRNRPIDLVRPRPHLRDAFVPRPDHQAQQTNLPQNATRLPERYPPAVRDQLYATLDATGRVVPPMEDEAHVNGRVPTTYAQVDQGAGVLYVSIDNAAYHSRGAEGISRGERRFARDMAEYAKQHGLTPIFMAHIPPTVGHKPGTALPTAQERKNLLGWMSRLRDEYPNSLWVHGHTHPGRDMVLDVDGKRHGREVSNLTLAGQVRNSVTKISTFEHGRRIDEYRVVRGEDGKPTLKKIGSVTTSLDGKVRGERYDLGDKKGVIFATSDVHASNTVKPYYRAIKAAAERAQENGYSVGFIDVGDHTVNQDRIPVRLPNQQNSAYAVGNHDYYNHGSLGALRRFLRLRW